MKHEWPIVEDEVLSGLREGRAAIARGWSKGPCIPDGPPCAIVAIWRIRRSDGHYIQMRDALARALPGWALSIIAFNDYWRTTQADILALYDLAIEAEMARRRLLCMTGRLRRRWLNEN